MHIHTSDQPELDLGFGGYSCNWGTHICGLYESEAERDEIVFGFLGEGLKAKDLLFYCLAEQTGANLAERFEEVNHTPLPQDPEQAQILPAKKLYYPEGHFDPRQMDLGLNQFYHSSQAHGSHNIRASAEMAWALERIPGVEHLMAYEARLNYFIPGKPWVSICLYNITQFSGATIMNVLRTHPYSISGGVVTENPYYQQPDVWLAQHAPSFAS